MRGERCMRARGDDVSAQAPGARADIDHIVGAADGVFIMLDHQQGIALVAQCDQGVEQHLVIARMQADRGLVEHIANTLQIGAELCRQPDALRLAARQSGRGTGQRQIAEPDVRQELQTRADLGQDVAGDLGRSSLEAHAVEPASGGIDRHAGECGNRLALQPHRERHAIETLSVAGRAGCAAVFDTGIGGAFHARREFVGADLADGLEPGTQTRGTPAVLGVEGEQARVEFGKARATGATGALGGVDRGMHRSVGAGRVAGIDGRLERIEAGSDLDDPFAERERRAQGVAQFGFAVRRNHQIGDRQIDVVLGIAVDTRPLAGRQEGAVDAKMGESLGRRPLGEVGIDALASDHQRGEQADALTAVLAQDARGNGVKRLRLDAAVAGRTMLGAELDVEQPQEVIDLGERGHRALASAATGALLDRDRRRNAEDAVDIGSRGRLHELARIGIERFEVSALAFAENHIEGQGRLAAARDTGDHGELVARHLDIDILQIVFTGVVHHDCIARPVAQAGLQRHAVIGIAGRITDAMRGGGDRCAGIVCAQHGLGRRTGCRSIRRRRDGRRLGHLNLIFAQRAAGHTNGVRCDGLRCAHRDHFAAGVAAVRAEVDQPVGRTDHVEVVFDHQQ